MIPPVDLTYPCGCVTTWSMGYGVSSEDAYWQGRIAETCGAHAETLDAES